MQVANRIFAVVTIPMCLAFAASGQKVSAAELGSLKPGLYVSTKVGCSGLGGAGTMDFDGANFSGHYQLCRTQPIQGSDRYRSNCIEAQGPKKPLLSDIDKDPDKVTEDISIRILSTTSFMKNAETYQLCGARW